LSKNANLLKRAIPDNSLMSILISESERKVFSWCLRYDDVANRKMTARFFSYDLNRKYNVIILIPKKSKQGMVIIPD